MSYDLSLCVKAFHMIFRQVVMIIFQYTYYHHCSCS